MNILSIKDIIADLRKGSASITKDDQYNTGTISSSPQTFCCKNLGFVFSPHGQVKIYDIGSMSYQVRSRIAEDANWTRFYTQLAQLTALEDTLAYDISLQTKNEKVLSETRRWWVNLVANALDKIADANGGEHITTTLKRYIITIPELENHGPEAVKSFAREYIKEYLTDNIKMTQTALDDDPMFGPHQAISDHIRYSQWNHNLCCGELISAVLAMQLRSDLKYDDLKYLKSRIVDASSNIRNATGAERDYAKQIFANAVKLVDEGIRHRLNSVDNLPMSELAPNRLTKNDIEALNPELSIVVTYGEGTWYKKG